MNNSSGTNNEKKRKIGAFGISVLTHGLILLAIAMATVQLTMPEGNVEGTIEFTAIPQGSQLDTPNVAKVAQPEIPEKQKFQAAPSVPKPAPPIVKEKSEVPDDFLKTDAAGEVPVPLPQEDKPAAKEPEVVDEEQKHEEKAVPDEPPQRVEAPPVQTPPQQAPIVPGSGGPTNAQVGNDAANLKGQERVADQTYGTAQGVKLADQYLHGIPGNRKPEYPWMARLRRIEGQAVAVFYVSADGKVSNLRVVQTTNPMFVKVVLEAMASWKFVPPVEPGEYAKPWNFTLHGEAKETSTLLRRK